MPLNPYERYELTGMTDSEIERERQEREDHFWDNYPDYETEDFLNELEEIFNDAL